MVKRDRIDMKRDVAVVVSQPGGEVVAQNERSLRVIGPGIGLPCWDVLGRAPLARALPCHPDCVGELLDDEDGHTQTNTIAIGRRKYSLCCAPVGGRVVSVVSELGEAEAPERGERLSPREVDILGSLSEGLETPAIAERLGIAASTVRTHVEHMRAKLGVRTRAALVARGFRLHYLK